MSQTRIAGGKWILLVLAVAMLATPALAQGATQPATMAGSPAANVEAEPAGTGGDSLAGETVNLYVSGADGAETTYSFDVTAGEHIENLERGAREDATVTMRTDERTFERVAHAPNPERKFQTAVEQGDVDTRVAEGPDDARWDVFSGIEELARSLGLS